MPSDASPNAADAAVPAPSVAIAGHAARSRLRLLHTADWQIGKQFGQFDAEDAALLAQARFDTVTHIAELATREQVDAVLVAGDVFDMQTVSDRTLHRLFHSMAGFTGPWVMLPGNHDAALAESVWRRIARLRAAPSNVHLCLTPEPLLLADIHLAVLPAPLTQRHTYNDLTVWFDQAQTPDGWWRVGVAHGSVQGILAEGIDSSNPIEPARAARAHLDYLALGDWHGTRQIDARTWYSGTPETDRFRANASGQVLLVDCAPPLGLAHMRDGSHPDLQPAPVVRVVPTTHYQWRTDPVTVAVPSDVDALIDRCETLGPRDVWKLVADGVIDLAGQQRLHAALEKARGRARAMDVDITALRLAPTDDDIAGLHADGYLGEVIAVLRDAQQPAADGTAQQGEARRARDALALLATMLVEAPR